MKQRNWKKLLSFMLSFVLVFGLFCAFTPDKPKAAEQLTFTVSADKTELHRGDTVTLSVNMSGNTIGTGLSLVFTYDDSILEYQGGASVGEVATGCFATDLNDTKSGTIQAVLITLNSQLNNGTVFTAKFRVKDMAKGEVSTAVSAEMSDDSYNIVDYGIQNDASSMKVVIPATGISLNKQILTLGKGAEEILQAVLTPADSEETVAWSSSDTSVATVDQTGKVTAVGKGTAIITAKAGSFSATCKVTVNIPLQGISIKGTASTIKKNQTAQLSVVYDPTDTTDDRSVTWFSSDNTIATVNNNGLVTAMKDGKATITAKVGNRTASYEITVQEIKLTSINIRDAVTIHKGEKEDLTVTYVPENTTDDKFTTWRSSDTAIATVDGNGTVTAVAPGKAIITAKTGNFEDTCEVTVDAPLKEIVPDSETIDLVKNQTGVITYTFNPADTTDSREVAFKSSDPTIVEVDGQGNLTAKKSGTAKVTLTGANNVMATVSVNVTEIPIGTVSLNAQSKIVEKGESITLQASVGPENNTDDDQTITWSSSDETIATVSADGSDSTRATVIASESKGGKVVITAKAWNGTSAVCEITVPNHIESISLPNDVEINRGNTKILDVTVIPSITDDDATVTWSSSDSSVATVDAVTGMITGIKEGTATITATTKVKNISTGKPYTASTVITVKENHMTDDLGKTIAFTEIDPILKGQTIVLFKMMNLKDIIEENQITDHITVEEWSSADEDIAIVDQTGCVLGVKEGKTVIAAIVKAVDGSGNEKTYEVKTEVEVKEIPLQSIAFNKVITEMQVGATDELTIIYNPEDTTDLREIAWSSSDENILSVENGKLTARKAGVATITAKVGDKTVSCKITVKEAPKNGGAENGNDKTNNQATQQKTNHTDKKSSDAVKTDDTSNIVWYVVLLLGAVVVMRISMRAKRRKVNR